MIPYETKEVLLKVEGLSKSYDVPIIHDINFEVHNITRPEVTQGQIISLVGKSGCGKSTLFRLLAGLEKQDSGTIKILNKKNPLTDNVLLGDVQEGDMGVVFQNSYVYPWRKVKTILRMAASKNRSSDFDTQTAIEHYSNLFSLDDHLNKYANQLSGGQRQRVAIAEQILNGGDFVLLDEPLSGLDTLTIDKVTETLTKVALEGEHKTIIIISHDLSNSLAISDTAFILSKPDAIPDGWPDGASTITHQICLATQGLAWQPDIKENPLFRDLLKHVKSLL